jgi:hypothetical protein
MEIFIKCNFLTDVSVPISEDEGDEWLHRGHLTQDRPSKFVFSGEYSRNCVCKLLYAKLRSSFFI